MNFQDTFLLLHLLWVVPLFVGLCAIGVIRRKRLLMQSFPDASQRDHALQEVARGRRRLRWVLLAFTLVGIVVALSRPQYGHRDLGSTGSGGDITIVLDISRSMYARDSKPDRLTVAKNVVRDLVAALPSHRFSLIVFAGKSYTACPMTGSKSSFLMILNDVSPITMPYGGTNLEEALRESLKAKDATETANRSVVILSDGDVLQGVFDPLLSTYKELGIPVMTVGVGTTGSNALIQLPDKSFVRFDDQLVRTSLNPAPLKALANGTGGRYWQAGEEPLLPEQMAAALTERLTTGGSSRIRRPNERYQWPLACALICLGGAIGISDKKRRVVSALLIMMLLPFGTLVADDRPEPVVQAELALEKETNPNDKAALRYQLAVILQIHQMGDQAMDHYKQVILSNHATERLRSSAMRNLAVIYFLNGTSMMNGTPEDAISAFNNVIVLSKATLEMHYNEDVAKMLESAYTKRIQAEEAFRRQEALKRLKQQAVESIKSAADAQSKANETTKPESQPAASELTKQAEGAASKLKDDQLDTFMNRAVDRQAALQKPENRSRMKALQEDALEALVQALQHLGVTYKKPNQDNKQAGTPPKEIPKELKFDEETDKKKRAIMILRAMKKDEEDQLKEIRNAREKAFRARLGEARDW